MRSVRSTLTITTLLLGAGAFAPPAGAQSTPRVAPKPAAGLQQAAPATAPLALSSAVIERAKTHNFRPGHINASVVRQESLQESKPAVVSKRAVKLTSKPRLNVTKLGEELHAALKDNVRGYAFQVRKRGEPLYTLIWDSARSADEGGKGWTLDTRMHVASVSKLLTAFAAVKMLDERGLTFDTKIGAYLPSYWTVGTNSADITFRELLTHTAGFTGTYYDGDYATFKKQIEVGVAENPSKVYTNGAFSLVRVLNATMTGAVPKNASVPPAAMGMRDALWDILTSNAFETYVANKVFAPSGVTGITSTASSASAFAYTSRTDKAGWDSGELQTQLGGAGFRASVNDVLKVMHTFRRTGKIVSAVKAQEALDAKLGVDVIDETPAGKMYLKNGWWGGGGQDGNLWHVEQAVAAFLPDDMEAVILVNSNIGWQQASLTQTFRNAVTNNIQ